VAEFSSLVVVVFKRGRGGVSAWRWCCASTAERCPSDSSTLGKGSFLGDVKWTWGEREGEGVWFGLLVYPTIPALLSWARWQETGPAYFLAVPKGTRADGAIQGAPPEFVTLLNLLSSDTLTHGKVPGPLVAAHRVVISALRGVFLHPLLLPLGLPGFTVLGVLTGNLGVVDAFSEPRQLPGYVGTEGVNGQDEHRLVRLRSKASK